MSEFLGFESFLVPLGASIQDVQDTFESALTSAGWQLQRRAKPPLAILGTIPNPANALDMVDSTYAGYYVVVCNIGIQMAAPFTPCAMAITGEAGAASDAPKAFSLDYSDDGNSWTTMQSWADEGNWTPWEQRRYLVPGASAHAYWRLSVTENNGSAGTYFSEWALEDAALNKVTSNQFIDIIPPATETIGNADAMDVLRLEFGDNYIRLRGLQYARSAVPQVIAIWQKTAGEVAGSVEIGGVTVTGATGTSGSTAKQNLRALYEAIRASSDANFLDWTWEYQRPAPQNSGDDNDYIYGVRKTLAPNIAITPSATVSAGICGSYSAAGAQSVNVSNPATCTLTTDLANGFIYYLQVNARGIALATKTNSAYYGPIHACYANNAKALAALPASGWAVECTPIELLIGWDGGPTYCNSEGRATHYWGMSERTSGTAQDIVTYGNKAGTPFGKLLAKSKVMDISLPPGAYYEITAALSGSSLFAGADAVGNDFQVHRVSGIGESIGHPPSIGETTQLTTVLPCLEVSDWYKFVGTATDEALLLVADTVAIAAMSAAVSEAVATIPVVSTAGFQAAGFLVLEGEIIQYTGTTDTTFTGCTRGKYGTTATAHFLGDAVSQGLWITKINGGALFCGYEKPS